MERELSSRVSGFEDEVTSRMKAILAEPAPAQFQWGSAVNFVVERAGTCPDSAITVRWDDAETGARKAWRYRFWYEGDTRIPYDRASGDPDVEVQQIAWTLYEGLAGKTFRAVLSTDPDGTVWVDEEPV